MSAAVGHIKHIHEHLNLRIVDILKIISMMCDGSIEDATEKFDGMNLVFTYDVDEERLKVARRSSDIPKGGLDALELAARFEGRGNIESVFVKAYAALESFSSSISQEDKLFIFGPGGSRWYSIELIHQDTLNTIHYDGNHIVFHVWPVFEKTLVQKVNLIESKRTLDKLFELVKRFPAHGEFEFSPPTFVKFSRLDAAISVDAHLEIGTFIKTKLQLEITPELTLLDVTKAAVAEQLRSSMGVKDAVIDVIVKKIVDDPDSMHANDIKKLVRKMHSSDVASLVGDMMKDRENVRIECLRDLTAAVYVATACALKDINPSFVSDKEAETRRLRIEFESCLKYVKLCNIPALRLFVEDKLLTLGSPKYIVPIEGVVIVRNNEAIKLTGAFAPAHQIISMLKYNKQVPERYTRKVKNEWKNL